MAKTLRARTPGDRGRVFWICLFLVAITWLVFGQTLTHDFVNFDDKTYVYGNPVVTSGLTLRDIAWAFTHAHARNWHPLTTISHMLDCQLFGLKAGGHHFTNVLLHTVSVLLLFLLLYDMTSVTSRGVVAGIGDAGRDVQREAALWRSAFVATVFAIHPLHVESVAWIAERKDVLSGVFFMLTLGAYVRYTRKPTLAHYVTTLVLFGCGLMSKPMLVTVPFVLLLLDYWPLRRGQKSEVRSQRTEVSGLRPAAAGLRRAEEVSLPSRSLGEGWSPVVGRLVCEKIPLFALSAASCVATLIAQSGAVGAMEPLPLAWRIKNVAASYVAYIWQMLWPAKLAVFYPASEPRTLSGIVFAFVFLIAVSAIAIGLRKRHPYIFTGWFWYLGMLVPVIGVFQIGLQSHADRYTYLPQIGLYLLVTWTAGEIWKTSNVQRPTSNVEFSGTHSALGVRRWAFGVCFSVVILLACLAWHQTKFWKNSETLWTHALGVTSNNDVAHNNLGLFFAGRGQIDDAISQYESALEMRSGAEEDRYNLSNALVHTNLGNALVQKDQLDEAIEHYEKAVELRPDYADGHFNLGAVLAREGRLDEAIDEWEKTLSIQPQDADAHITLGDALLRKGDTSGAIAHYNKALEIAPDSISTLNNLAWVFSTCPDASLRNGARAIELAQKAGQLAGGKDGTLMRTLAAAYAETGQFTDAIETAQRATHLARVQGDMTLANDLEKDLDLYRSSIPLRRSGPPGL
jgi:protein O-mannosyl-transferase